MSFFKKVNTFEDMVEGTIINWESKINAPEDDMKLLLETGVSQLHNLMGMAVKMEHLDRYANWFYSEANSAIQYDDNRILLLTSVNGCLARVVDNGLPKEYEKMTMFEPFYNLYNAVLKEKNEKPVHDLLW